MPDELDASFDDASPAPETTEETVVVEDSLGNQFLSKIPEQDRPIVGKYVKDWDGNVTKKFQELRGQLKPYQELGDLEQIQKAHNFYNNFRTNGNQVFGQMVKGFFDHYGENAPTELNKLLGIEMPNEEVNDWEETSEEPDPNEVFQQNVSAELEQLREFKETYEQQQLEAQLEKQVDSMVTAVHNTRSDIPEKFVLQGIAAGAQPEAIIAFYDEIRNSGSQQAPRNPPPIMGGQGGVPSGQVDVTNLTPQQRKAAVAQYLAAGEL
jgi:hypothetical protein